MARHVTEHNITAWVYGLTTGEEYKVCPMKTASTDEKLSPHSDVKKEQAATIFEGDEEAIADDTEKTKADGGIAGGDEGNKMDQNSPASSSTGNSLSVNYPGYQSLRIRRKLKIWKRNREGRKSPFFKFFLFYYVLALVPRVSVNKKQLSSSC